MNSTCAPDNLFVVTCRDLVFGGGHVRYSNESLTGHGIPFGYYPVGTIAYFKCNGFNHLSENITRTCNTSGDWDQENPECIQSNHILFKLIV